jgi:hypothetical protein
MTYRRAFSALGFVLLVQAFAMATDLYYFWKPLDIPMHLAGGLATGLLALALLDDPKRMAMTKMPRWFRLLFVCTFVSLVAVLWEFHECLLDQTVNHWLHWGTSQLSNLDTMGDLLNGLIGAAGAWLFFDKR